MIRKLGMLRTLATGGIALALLALITLPVIAQSNGNFSVVLNPMTTQQSTLKVDNSTNPNRTNIGCETDLGGVGGTLAAGSTAVNGIRATGGATGSAALIAAVPCANGDANPGLGVQAFGTGTLTLGASGQTVSIAAGASFTNPGASTVQVGTSGVFKSGPLVIFHNATAVGNTADTNEDVLHTFTMAGNSLVTAGQHVRIETHEQNAATADLKRTRVYFGATVILDTTAIASNNNWWSIICDVWMVTAVTQKAVCHATNDTNGGSLATAAGGGVNLTTPGETLSGPIVIKVTGQDSSAATANAIIAQSTLVEWYPAGQ